MEELTKEQQEELQKLANDMLGEAEKVKEDYKSNPSNISGSFVSVHENSPFLDVDENQEPLYSGSRWEKVLKGSVDDAMSFVSKKKIKKLDFNT